MDLERSLRQECIQLEVEPCDKRAILKKIAALAKKSPLLDTVEEGVIYDALVAREDVGSTGFEDGIAIPHCRLEGISEFVVGLVVVPSGLDFDSMDGEKTRLLFFVIGPDDRNAYVRLLSCISRAVGVKEIRKKIFSAPSVQVVFETLAGHAESRGVTVATTPICTFQIVVQCEDRFTDILQTVSSLTDGIDVIETRGAGHYLHNLPIFSTFWTSEEKQFHRIILGVVRRDLVNELARGVNVAAGGLDERSGVLLAIQDCLFSQGSLES